MIDHMGIQVADVEASLAFYLRTFAPIGMREAIRFPNGDTFVVGLSGADGVPNFWLSQATGPEARELHLAFRAARSGCVRRFAFRTAILSLSVSPAPTAFPTSGSARLRVLRPGNCTLLSGPLDRKSTRLNSSHLGISYAVFCLKKNKS